MIVVLDVASVLQVLEHDLGLWNCHSGLWKCGLNRLRAG